MIKKKFITRDKKKFDQKKMKKSNSVFYIGKIKNFGN